ncbi:MAG: HD domain-containing protein [Chitinophagaceae bacterium]|nr:HD domain-containing protein [Chitinophagaceae bacterium]
MLFESFHFIHDHVVHNLLTGLSEKLTYHNLPHTLDVLKQVQRIGKEEGIMEEEDMFLLKTAALYHDTGFLSVYAGHEAAGCELARKDLPGFGFSKNQTEQVCSLIMATKIPQSPKNILEEIICDADLDYLGRDDFEPISDSLRREFLELGIVRSDEHWYSLQIKFIENHNYFTNSSRQLRNPEKLKRLEKLKSV